MRSERADSLITSKRQAIDRLSICLLVLIAAFGSFWAGERPASAQENGGYEVEIEGVPDGELLEILQSVSDTYEFREQTLPTISLLRNRARNDIPRLLEALASWGYFKADVQVDIRREGREPVVVFQIDPGPQFLLERVSIVDPGGEPSEDLPGVDAIGLKKGAPFRAQAILDARDRLLLEIGNAGRPFPEVLETEVVADHDTNGVRVMFRVNPGPLAWFGSTEIEGLSRVREDYAATLVPWDEGNPFREDLIAQARIDLIRSGLFSLVEICKGEIVAETNRLPMFLTVRERRHRTMRAGLNYTTDFGVGAIFGWEHRNLFGRGEFFETQLSVNELRQSLDTDFQKPNFLREDQRLVLRSILSNEDLDAYESRTLRNSAMIQRDLSRSLTVGAGVGFDYLDVREDGGRDTFYLFSIPLSARMNTTDDLLDPSRGFTLSVLGTPFIETLGENVSYLRYDLSGSAYLQVVDDRRLILAARGRYGQILGAERARVPATERFYAGGGGSVRGYPFQSLSPLDENDDPTGGLSIVELSFEVRTRVSERLGFVLFADGGRAFESDTPDPGEKLFWGVGAGLRYFTVIGPVRLDVAFPIQNRAGVDDSFQVYISIGQSF
jgi:translocation and assembly module TamA